MGRFDGGTEVINVQALAYIGRQGSADRAQFGPILGMVLKKSHHLHLIMWLIKLGYIGAVSRRPV